MGRKKKKIIKPWCWYCNRDFEDDKVLIQHQKAKHFKCHVCYKKLYTGPGLAVHCQQVHKETIDKIPNSLPSRGSTELEIYGMEGIPEADMKKHEAEVLGKPVDDEPADKKVKLDFPVMPPGFMPPMAGLKNPLIPTLPMPMMPGMPPMPYGSMMPGLIPPIRRPMPPVPSMVPTPSVPVAAPPPLPPPSAATPLAGVGVTPTFPAYSSSQMPTAAPLPPMPSSSNFASATLRALPADLKPTTSIVQAIGTKIVHPDEDVSLEERRASFPKYTPAGGTGMRSKGVGISMVAPYGAGGFTRPVFPLMPMSGYGYNPMSMPAMPTYGYPVVPPTFPHPPRPANHATAHRFS